MLRRAFLGVLVALALSSCSSIVRKPEINSVRTVAVASLFAPSDVLNANGRGRYAGWSMETKHRVAQMAHQAFDEEMKRLRWKTIPYQTVVANAYYQKEFGKTEIQENQNILEKGLAVANRVRNMGYFTLPKMSPIEFHKESAQRQTASLSLSDFSIKTELPLNEKLEKLALALNVDAVALVQMDYCYGGGKSVLGNGEAYILGQATMYMVDKRGVEVVKLPNFKSRCETDPYGGKSTNSTGMIAGDLILKDDLNGDKLVKMFYQATKATAHRVVGAINVAMNEK